MSTLKPGTAGLLSVLVLGAGAVWALASDGADAPLTAVRRPYPVPVLFADRLPGQPSGLFLRAFAHGRLPRRFTECADRADRGLIPILGASR